MHDHRLRYRVRVTGRVQGVWYRETCRRRAVAVDVAGWVRNNADGTVEAVIEGEPPSLVQLLAWMRSGPRRAVVTDVDVREEPPQGEQGFSVM